jgi:hypothetical protein
MSEQLLRVERGNPDAHELAALTVVLLARRAGGCSAPDELSRRQRAVALWRRPERSSGFDGPRTWRRGTPHPARFETGQRHAFDQR